MERSVNVIASGSGWPRGAAFIGTLQVLNDSGIVVDKALGVSGGGLVFGTFAAFAEHGRNDSHGVKLREQAAAIARMRDMLTEFQIQDLLDLNWWPFGARKGIFGGNKLLDFMRKRLPQNFPEAVKTRLVTANISRGVPHVWEDGDFPLAMRATMSLPSIFDLVEMNGDLHMDGGLQANFPVDYFEPEPTIGLTFNRSGIPSATRRKFTTKLDVVNAAIGMMIDATTAQHVEDAIHARTVYIKTDAPGFDPRTTVQQVERIILEGEVSTRKYLRAWEEAGTAPWLIVR